MHFKNQQALIVREKGCPLKSKRLRSVEELAHRAQLRQSLPPDTDSRLLTEMNSCRTSSRSYSRPGGKRVQSQERRVCHFVQGRQLLTALRDEGLQIDSQ